MRGAMGLGNPVGPYGVPVTPWRLCMGCGRWIPWTYNVCPMCGTVAPLAPWVPRAPEGAPPVQGIMPAQGAPPSAAPSPPPTPPEPVRAPCPTCDGQAEWLAAVRRWYCRAENRSF